MNYILLCEGFNDWCENNHLSALSRLLWFDLVHLFNRRGWCEWLQVSNQRLMDGLQLTREQTFISTRDKLIEKDLFLYEKGKKRSPSKYKFNTELTFINVAANGVQSVVQPVVKSVVNSVVETVARNKHKQIQKQNYIESNKLLSRSNSDSLFEKFWSIYPKKVAKQAAIKVFRKIPKIEATLEKILVGVEIWKDSEQCQNPQFIPNPATFLNNRRWEDEIPKGGTNNGARRSVNADLESEPKINKYPNHTEVDWSIFDGCET